ncbi:hypothetical protein ABFS82_07G053300 [Erythranthe guttata]
MEVSLDSLEHSHCFLFAFLYFVFGYLMTISLHIVNASVLADAASIFGRNNLNMISDRFDNSHQSISFNYAVAVRHILRIESIDTVLDALKFAAFSKMDDLDRTCTSTISLQYLDIFYSMWHYLRNERVSIKNDGLKHLRSRDRRRNLHIVSDATHIIKHSQVNKLDKIEIRERLIDQMIT